MIPRDDVSRVGDLQTHMHALDGAGALGLNVER
jgi:hypothetical protein